jgi:hypothetical protein
MGRALFGESPLSVVIAGFSPESNGPQTYTIRMQFDRRNERLLYPAPEKVFLPRDQQFQFRFGTQALFLITRMTACIRPSCE